MAQYALLSRSPPRSRRLRFPTDKDLQVDDEVLTARQAAQIIEKTSGQKVVYKEVDAAAFDKSKDLPYMHEIWAK